MREQPELLQRAQLHIAPGVLSGTLSPPPSKSLAHRALICAALAGGMELVSGLNRPSEDIAATRQVLRQLMQHAGSGDTEELDCGESGTTLRLLIPVAAALGVPAVWSGHGRLPERPLREYGPVLEPNGIRMEYPETGSLPLSVSGKLRPGVYTVPGNVSSQYVSGLLLALPLLDGPSEIRLTSRLESASYVDLTCDVATAFGIVVEKLPPNDPDLPFGGYRVPGGQRYHAAAYRVEADYSQAAFWLAANRLGSDIRLTGLPHQTRQGDAAVVPMLEQLCDGTDGITLDVSQTPDLVPVLAAVAAYLPRETRLVGAARLRIKESDRLAAVEGALGSIGADIRQTDDGLVIRGRSDLEGGVAHSWHDHRIAMAVAVAALRTRRGVDLIAPGCVAKSYPLFYDDFLAMGGSIT